MSFAARITRAPRPFEPERGAEGRALFAEAAPEVAQLIEGTAGSSPFLLGLMHKEAAWLTAALDDPERALEAELAAIAEMAPDALPAGLRRAKRRVALLVGLADLGGVWPLEQVTAALTRLADAAVDRALKTLVGAEIARGKVPGLTPQDAETAGGMVALSMGKAGAHELNYSSDIDLIVLFDETRIDPDSFHEVRAAFIRVTRRMAALIGENTADGYVFRTDLRLRPDASVTPVCISFDAAERYYESVGRTWERAAYIKARPCAGDIAAGERFLATLTPFVWRKHLDFAAIQDAHDMRLRIREHKGLGGAICLEGHDLKLGRGGIREIEFFTQTRQLIAGGRDESLRCRDTVGGLGALAAAGWVGASEAERLVDHYREHREIEHRLQMINDAQTHKLPGNAEGFARLAAFMDVDADAWRARLTRRLEEVHSLTEGFFAPGQAPADTVEEPEIVEGWLRYPALRSPRAVEIFERLKPDLLRRLNEAAKPDEALLQFDSFLKGLPAGVQLFSLFEANPQLTQLIVDICATAPALAAYLGRNSSVFDAVIAGEFFADWPGRAALEDGLAEALAAEADYERKLDAARRWSKEWHFRVGVHHLRRLIDAAEAGRNYADLADAVVAGLYPAVVADFARKHGPPPGRGAVVLGMGSLGARRLHAASDLDLIVIYDPGGATESDGPRPLGTRPYFARLTQALVTALTAPMAEGRLYEVDMRLRPSGRQGPVATALATFEPYQMDEAWTWEHLALTRARVIAGDARLAADVEAVRSRVLAAKGPGDAVLGDVARMRARIAAAKPGEGDWDAKIGPGRLQDVELCAQAVALRAGSVALDTGAQVAAGVAAGVLDAGQGAALCASAELFWRLQASARLLTGGVLDPETLGAGGRAMVLRETGQDSIEGLRAEMQARAEAARAVIDAVIGTGDPE
ncbi:MAG: glutamate-ammonia-ligase adenylyltransferase GlnE [Rhodobacteraceae bacterium HLUCCA08]|nr:MAG: glutamate-ammonia-ligase adenylyltransferase GlnE [Rhodobacteraceae bacterium HLUCCA08]